MANQVPYSPWLQLRLKSMFDHPPRYENSFYGPINAILNSAFSSGQNFLVKPQAVLIPNDPIVSSSYLPPGTSQHPDASRSSSRIAKAAAKATKGAGSLELASHIKNLSIHSIDSLGDNILPRSAGGKIQAIFIPDFLVVKATEDKSSDMALVLVEVKLEHADVATSIKQVELYIARLQTKNYSRHLIAFLCVGRNTFVWTTSGQGNNLVQTMLPLPVRTGGVDFCNYIRATRMHHVDG